MKADIRIHRPLREDVRSGLTTLLVQARQIWGKEHRHSLGEVVVRLTVGVGDLARLARDGTSFTNDTEAWSRELRKEMGNIILSTVRWMDDFGLDPMECLDLAIEAQEKFANSGRPR